MRLKSITLKNFRCFEHLEVDLHPRLTVFVGENGAGKTALLDGIASVFTPVLTYFSSANQRLSGRGIKDSDFRVESFQGRGGREQWGVADYAQVQAQTVDGLRWDYWRPSSGSKAEPADRWGEAALKERIGTIVSSYKTQAPALTPAFVYYGASRGHIEVPERLRGVKNNYDHPTAALVDCFNPSSDFREMLEWFDQEEASELRANKGVVDDDFAPFQTLETVRAAVVGLLRDFSNPHFNNKHKFMLKRTSDGAPMLVNQLSQGYQSMLALAMDFSRRLAIANAHLVPDDEYVRDQIFPAIDELEAALGHSLTDEPIRPALPMSAPAIMLVDEIDLHLHPSWQQRVLQDLMRTFPLTQFIVTTHSPQVLSTVRRENIRVLGQNSADMPLATTYGQPSGDVMHSVMLVDPLPPITEAQRLSRLTALVDQGLWETAEASDLMVQLSQELGPENARLQQLQRSIQRQAMLRDLAQP